MTSSISPDDVCGVCNTIREEHGDKNHVFSLDDTLIPVKPGGFARRQPPEERKTSESKPDLHLAFATLMEILAEKKFKNPEGYEVPIINTQDVIRIFRGQG